MSTHLQMTPQSGLRREGEVAGAQASMNTPRDSGFHFPAGVAASARLPSRHPQLFHFSGQCFLRFASKNPPSNSHPSRAHGGTLTTNALEKKGTDGSFIAHLEMFPRLLFSSPIHSCGIAGICQLQSPEAAAGGPGPPRTPARGRPLAVAPSRASENADSQGLRGLGTDAGVGSLVTPHPSSYPCSQHVRGRLE